MSDSNSKNVKIVELVDLNLEQIGTEPGSIVLSDNINSVDVLSICAKNDVKHIVQKSNLTTEKEIRLSASMILKPTQFMNFPISSILAVAEPTAKTEKEHTSLYFEFTNAEQKSEIVDLVGELTLQFGNTRNPISLSNDVKAVADELITNSIYNAPFVDPENNSSGVAREPAHVSIDPLKKPAFFLGGDNERLIIGSRDLYGSLNVKKILSRIRSCYENDPQSMMSFDDGGAGIGAFLIFDSCTSMYIAVDAGRMTTVCCAFPLRLTANLRHMIPKNLHVWF